MISRGIRLLQRGFRHALNAPKTGALILMYHRIAVPPLDPFRLSVAPAHFAEHLDVLARGYNVISLETLLTQLEDQKLPPRTVVITFDDGYYDLLTNAQPELKKVGMRATVAIPTGYVRNHREPWWDELEHICSFPGQLPSSLRIEFPGEVFSWQDTSHTSEHGTQSVRLDERGWHMRQRHDHTPRQKLYRGLYRDLKLLHPEQQEAKIQELFSWAQIPRAGCENHRLLSSDEIRQLDSEGIFEFGAHTRNHCLLSQLTEEEQWAEIVGSKRELEEFVGHEVQTFFYPYGCLGGPGTKALVERAGYKGACSGDEGVATSTADRFLLPRHEVWDCDGAAFERQLRNWWMG
jgi:peptidoglycan/xylan/chitin deacetylase (PgdA/CDA1 family)